MRIGVGSTMNVIQATFGVFHQFDLARELHLRGYLSRIYSTFPRRRLERERIPAELLVTFPYVHTTRIMLERAGVLPNTLRGNLSYLTATSFDRWVAARIPPCDVLIAIAGAALLTAKKVQGRGGISVCDCGSAHRVSQNERLVEEHRRWKLPFAADQQREIAREVEIYQTADALVVPSNVAKRSFVERGHRADTVHVIPYGVALERFCKVADPPAPGDVFNVLFVGGVSLRKGIPYLLQAFAALKHPRKRLRILGSVSPQMGKLLETLPLAEVEFVGTVSQGKLKEYMSRSHVLVLPSIEDGFGLVVPQAMACGCPVLVSSSAGASDLVEEGTEGFVVAPRDVPAMTDRLQQLADDSHLQRGMGAAAMEQVRSLGGWRDYGDRWEQLLLTLTKSG